MEESEVKRRAFAMPLTSPALSAGPYRFCQPRIPDHHLSHRSGQACAPSFPSRCELTEPLVKFEFIRMPDSTGFGDYTESGQVIPVSFQAAARAATPTACSSTTRRRSPAAASSGAFPRSSPADAARREGHAGRHARLRPGARRDRHDGLQAPRRRSSTAVLTSLLAPNFLLKIIPHVDGTPRICELVEYHLEDVDAERRLDRPGRAGTCLARAGAGRRAAGARDRLGARTSSPI